MASRACPPLSDRNFYSDTHWQTLSVAGCCIDYQQWKVFPSGKYLIRQAESRSDQDTTQRPDGYKCQTGWAGTVRHVQVPEIVSHMDIKFNVSKDKQKIL